MERRILIKKPMLISSWHQLENIQMGFVEVLDGFSVDPGLADYRARNIHSENAEAFRL